ncbi:MAG: [FeFe] hydrogenase H-cluster radical SAM maturase HydE [Armatimonadota bacterium]
MDKQQILNWLKETDERRLQELWSWADEVRRQHVGDAIYLRGLIEFSNHCARLCGYCGLRADNQHVTRYRMSADEILQCSHRAQALGYGTVVLQSGEDYGIKAEWLADMVRRIKAETGLAVTLSVGERSEQELQLWREAGADRYLLRFETSNPLLFDRIHPSLPGRLSDRIALLKLIRSLGYEVGSGVMVGIPGQSYDDLAQDILTFVELDLDMIGIGPYLPHPETPIGQHPEQYSLDAANQVPADVLMTCKAIALTRIMRPKCNIPSTTALATLDKARGRELGLMRGANIMMPNVTLSEFRENYQIYPDKACLHETADHCAGCMTNRIAAIGRSIGTGRGDSPNYKKADDIT